MSVIRRAHCLDNRHAMPHAAGMAKMGRPVGLAGAWGEWAKRVGGVHELALLLHVSDRSLRNYASGRLPGGAARLAIEMIAAQHGVSGLFRK